MLQILPNAALYIITTYLTEETSFRDKVDIAIDAASLARTFTGSKALVREIISIIDPMSTDGKLTSDVLANLQRKKNKWIPARVATHAWGLSDDDLAYLPHKIIHRKDKSDITTYKLQDVKKFSERKFNGDSLQLYAYASAKQFKRSLTLFNALRQPIRPDSKYCESYIKTGKGNPQDIARLLKEMEFYHTYTTYPQLYWVYTQKYSLEYGYYDRDHISSDAKSTALNRFKKQHPDKLHLIPNTLLKFL